ncbi:328_t:CDS:1, partial [Racocetra persica]
CMGREVSEVPVIIIWTIIFMIPVVLLAMSSATENKVNVETFVP